MRLRQLAALAALVPQPGALRAIRTWRPFSVTSYRITRALARQGFTFRTVVDGGANAGQFARAAAETWRDARVISFEPLPDVAGVLRRNLGGLGARVRVEQAALGATTGVLPFYRAAYTLGSSALPPGDGASTRIEVPVVRLDDALAEEALARPVLLKLDLQGYEIEALRGGSATLARVDAVLIEVAFRSNYEGEPLFRDVLRFMEEAGFRFVRPLDVLDEGDQITYMDALFVPAGR